MAFDSVHGHERIRALLARSLAAGRLPPALLFAGPDGVGKRRLALALAQALICERAGEDACSACAPCSRVARGIHPDLVLVEPVTSAIKIEQVRDVALAIGSRPFEARARAFVIDDAHAMTEQAANALLKALEEPPATSHVVLVTSAPQALLPTIRSRCQILRFGALPVGVLEGVLRNEGMLEDEARLRATLACGSLGAARDFESEAYRALRDDLMGLLDAAPRAGVLERVEAAERLEAVEDPPLALTALRSLLRDVAALREGARPERLLNPDVASRLQPVARGPLGARAEALAAAAGEAQTSLRENANRALVFEVLLDAIGRSVGPR
jgi:DNA polymerase-3 subunit delta'